MVDHVRGPLARLVVAPDQVQGDLVRFEGGGRGVITALRSDHTEALCLERRPEPGEAATPLGPFAVGLPADPTGRLDLFGAPNGEAVPLWPRPPRALAFAWRRLELGPLVLDLPYPNRLTGGLWALGPRSDVSRLVEQQVALGRAVVVASEGGHWPGALVVGSAQRIRAALAPVAAAALAERLSQRGRDVVLIIDDPARWAQRSRGIEGLPPWPTLWRASVGRRWSGPHGSLTVWLATPRAPAPTLDVDHVVDLRSLHTGRWQWPTGGATSWVNRSLRVQPMRDLGSCLLQSQQPPPRGDRIRQLLRWRGPEDPVVALATFVALVDRPGADPELWPEVADAIRARGELVERMREQRRITTEDQAALRQLIADLLSAR